MREVAATTLAYLALLFVVAIIRRSVVSKRMESNDYKRKMRAQLRTLPREEPRIVGELEIEEEVYLPRDLHDARFYPEDQLLFDFVEPRRRSS
jgi:hypothetical protein